MTPENRKAAMKEIRSSEWFQEQGAPEIKLSPHSTRGLVM